MSKNFPFEKGRDRGCEKEDQSLISPAFTSAQRNAAEPNISWIAVTAAMVVKIPAPMAGKQR
ncbi:MAG: hypothetical protein OEV42_02810 [Deltaproteobacteria bacterium]|nr:hypothetical protein [Deltaproteobacteria bacterium]